MQAPKFDRVRFNADWREMNDPERAVHTALAHLRGVLDGEIEPDLAILEEAAEAAWDGPGADSKLVVDAMLKTQTHFREIEPRLKADQRVWARYGPQLLLARSWLRYGNPDQAFIDCFTGLRGLEELAGGRLALRDVISRPANPVGELAAGNLGLLPAALRRSELKPTIRFQFEQIGIALLGAYMGENGSPTIYPRSHAIGAQWFYYLVHDPDADEELIKALFRLDERTRPTDARSQGTLDSMRMEYEARFGSLERAEEHRVAALAALDRLPLIRHRAAVAQYGYLNPR